MHQTKKPFFARFLESQDLKPATGADGWVTKKYPSDGEDGGIFATKKYPSDADEFVTLKYPSDSEDGPIVTLKYPSDSEDGGDER